jgi:azurin
MINQLSTQPGKPRSTGLRRARGYLLGLAILLGLVAAGCSQGSYPLDIFYEMHYQQSYKSHEPPRLSAPESAVAWYPGPESTSFNDGRHLYMVNCAMCHGLTGQGDGPVLQTLINTYGYKPAVDPDLTSDQARAIGPGGIQGFMLSGVLVMPNFSKLLSVAERSAIVDYITGTLAPSPAGTTGEGQAPATTPPPTQAPAASAGPSALEIGVNGDALTFDKDSIEVASGSEVVLAFNNVSGINQHNWVVVQAGTKDAVATRGTGAGPGNDWVQPGDADVVANTKMLLPGESGEVRFTAPAAGTYQFVCTFPGHNFTMFGDFVVTP